MIYTNGQITKDLPVFGQIKVDQIVLILLRCVVLHEFLESQLQRYQHVAIKVTNKLYIYQTSTELLM